MKKLRTRLAFDAVLTMLLAFEMLFEVTGDTLHEIVGVSFFATIIAHLALSRKWIGATAKAVSSGKRMKPMARVRMALGILLAISMVVLMASSVAISNLLAGAGVDLAGSAYGTWALVHAASSYALCCLVVAHLGVHWASIASALKVPYNPERRAAISTGVTALGALGIAAIGMAGLKSVVAPAGTAIAETMPEGSSDEYVDAENVPYEEPKSDASNSTASGKGAKGNRHRKSMLDEAGALGAQEPSQEPAPTGDPGSSADAGSSAGSDASDGGNAGGDGNGNSSSNWGGSSGTCTLCRKNCPLSAPKCSKPYETGLLP